MATITSLDRRRVNRVAAALDGAAVTDPGVAALMRVIAALRVAGGALVAPEEFRRTLRMRLVAA